MILVVIVWFIDTHKAIENIWDFQNKIIIKFKKCLCFRQCLNGWLMNSRYHHRQIKASDCAKADLWTFLVARAKKNCSRPRSALDYTIGAQQSGTTNNNHHLRCKWSFHTKVSNQHKKHTNGIFAFNCWCMSKKIWSFLFSNNCVFFFIAKFLNVSNNDSINCKWWKINFLKDVITVIPSRIKNENFLYL